MLAELFVEERYSLTPFPERRLRLKLLRWIVTLWTWDADC